jgi:hypothetical protein
MQREISVHTTQGRDKMRFPDTDRSLGTICTVRVRLYVLKRYVFGPEKLLKQLTGFVVKPMILWQMPFVRVELM